MMWARPGRDSDPASSPYHPDMSKLRPGDLAPAIELPDDTGTIRRLADQRGRWTVAFFYPKDMTSGCTVEACEFRDTNADLVAEGATVWGISPQDEQTHVRFRDMHTLTFPLLVDADHAVADAYGVWAERIKDGSPVWENARTTFLIDPNGRIAHIWEGVKPQGHAEEVLTEIRARVSGKAAGR